MPFWSVFVDALRAELRNRRSSVEDVLDSAAGLFDQRQQEMLGVELRMTIALDDLVGACERILSAFGESVKSHHRPFLLSDDNYNPK